MRVNTLYKIRSVLLLLIISSLCRHDYSNSFPHRYYSASIIQMAGFSDQSAIWLATVPGGSNFIFTIVGLLLVDRLGRRKLLIGSVCGIIFGFLLLSGTFALMTYSSMPAQAYDISTCDYQYCGSCVGNSECGFCVDMNVTDGEYHNGTCSSLRQLINGTSVSTFQPIGQKCALFGENANSSIYDYTTRDSFPVGHNFFSTQLERKWYPFSCPNSRFAPLAIIALFLYIAFFAPGMGPLPWTINSEIYPTWARSTAISIATMTNWVCNLLVSMTFLTMADNLGQPITFGFYSGLCGLALVFIILFVPETKGRSLEEMGCLFRRPYFMNWFQ